jgi:WD40 repeat protein
VAQSGCLVSGEKHLNERPYKSSNDMMPKVEDPSIPLSHKFQKSSETTYQKHANREASSPYKSEIIIWNLQRDMVELFQTNPPWNIPIFKRFEAHNASIIDICYLQKTQLLVSTSTDQTIRFFDPISVSYSLTDPNNIPHAMQKPGYYRPLNKEMTKGNVTFKEVKRIYTGTDTSCYSLRCMNISNVLLEPQNPDIKS